MAQTAVAPTEPFCSPIHSSKDFFRTFDNRNGVPPTATDFPPEQETMSGTDDGEKTAVRRRPSRQVVPGLPRVQTFKRQQSEQRTNLAPAELTPDERRAVSVDRRAQASRALSQPQAFPRASAPGLLSYEIQSAPSAQAASVFGHPEYSLDGMLAPDHPRSVAEDESCYADDAHSYTTSAYDAMINEELERTWILNLSMHFRDKSKREKFFVTYWDKFKGLWRRVTVSLDYRHAPENSLEMDLDQTKYQREKSAKIYEAIRESLQDIQFYDTVTNLKLQTTDGRLHVHVVEDVNEIIPYPLVRQVQHLGCLRVRERDILFDSHMSGFVYKVNVGGLVLVKKEIPGPETVDEFLYEINALSRLRYSRSVIRFYGVVVDDQDEYIKGLLISYADQGALIDVLYDNRQDSELGTPWPIRERWARQIVEGLADIHESGFVQGDFTLSNIVIDDKGDAKIIDINRRGCPVGWEPPEATAVIESGQRLSMYIGVKSDLYQLGMVLWSLATQEDNPEEHSRPLVLEPDVLVPEWYRRVVERCLSQDPRGRPQASTLLTMFPQYVSVSENEGVERFEDHKRGPAPAISVNHSSSMREACLDPYVAGDHPGITTVNTYNDQWPYLKLAQPDDGFSYDPYYYTRGRSPPSPLVGHYPHFGPFHESHAFPGWASAKHIAPSYSDVGVDEMERLKSPTPTTSRASSSMLERNEDTTPTVPEGSSEQTSQTVGTISTSPTTQNTSFDASMKMELTDMSMSAPSLAEGTTPSHIELSTGPVSGSDLDPVPAADDDEKDLAPSSEVNSTDVNLNVASEPGPENEPGPEKLPTSQCAEQDPEVDGSLVSVKGKDLSPDAPTEVLDDDYRDPIDMATESNIPRTVEHDSTKAIHEGDTNHANDNDEAGNTAPEKGTEDDDEHACHQKIEMDTMITNSGAFDDEKRGDEVYDVSPSPDTTDGTTTEQSTGEDTSDLTPRPAREGSPFSRAEHPELNGVGAAHLGADAAALREKLSLDDDFTITTSSATATTTNELK